MAMIHSLTTAKGTVSRLLNPLIYRGPVFKLGALLGSEKAFLEANINFQILVGPSFILQIKQVSSGIPDLRITFTKTINVRFPVHVLVSKEF